MKSIRKKLLAILLAVIVAMSYSSMGANIMVSSAGGDQGPAAVHAAEKDGSHAKASKKGKQKKERKQKKHKQKKHKQKKKHKHKKKNKHNKNNKHNKEDKQKKDDRQKEDAEKVEKDETSEDSASSDESQDKTEKQENDSDSEEAVGETADTQSQDEDTADSDDPADKKASEKKAEKKGDSSGNATYKEVNNTTDLADGKYKPADFSFSGGTGKTSLCCDKVIVNGGKAKAVIRVTSSKFTHLFTGTIDKDKNTDDCNTDLYDPDSGDIGKGVYKLRADGSDVVATIPVSLNSKMDLAGRTTAMSDAHWVQYSITVKLSADDRVGDAGMQDGTYKPDSFTVTGGTGKASFTCEKVVVIDEKATAILKVSSDKMTHIYMGKASSNDEDPSLYDPDTKACGSDVYPIGGQTVSVPVKMNEDGSCAIRTTAMSAPHWVNYTYHLKLNASSEMISESTDIPENTNPEESTETEDPEDPAGPSDPADGQTLTEGTWKVKATTDRKMFYLYPKDDDPAWTILNVDKDGSMTATITLTGEGYDYVYMGTPEQAKAAGESNWIAAEIVNGYYTFTIPVSALDKKLDITPHSSKYASDNDPSTEPWRPDKWILFYSSDATKAEDGATIDTGEKQDEDPGNTSGKQKDFKNDGKKDKVSKWKDDRNKSTHHVDNSTSLKDGVYTPDRFSWSGGSGRLAYIRCNKITVTNGKAYATIEFSSTKYDSLKANGRVYSKQGGGNSTFVIPVQLNANNTIIGRTTAMSQPHWVKYTIFIYKAGATKGSSGNGVGTDGHVTNTNKLTDKAPDLLGLKSEGKVKIEKAEFFRIFKYEQGVTLIAIDQTTDTALYKKEPADDQKDGQKAEDNGSQGDVEYDEEGKPIAKSQNEITEELYENNVVNYLIAPEDVELPAGLEKDCVIIRTPLKSAYVASADALSNLAKLEQTDAISILGMDESKADAAGLTREVKKGEVQMDSDYVNPDFRQIVKLKSDLAILPEEVLPEVVTAKSTEEEKALSQQKAEELKILRTRYSSLSVPLIIDRAGDEKSALGKAEWVKVYGAITGTDEKAAELFDTLAKH